MNTSDLPEKRSGLAYNTDKEGANSDVKVWNLATRMFAILYRDTRVDGNPNPLERARQARSRILIISEKL